MTLKIKRLMIIAGGTGGHLFPGLAVAHSLMDKKWQIRWLGTANHMEATIVPQYGIDIDFIQINGLRGKRLKENFFLPIQICRALWKSKQIIQKWNPDVVLCMGGYISGPGGLAAWICGIPVILHEQNSIAGLTNRSLSKIATKVLQAFPSAFSHAQVVGNPIRNTVLSLAPPYIRFQKRTGRIRVLIIGGSQGAKILNQTMPAVSARLKGKLILWHQVGKNNLELVKKNYLKHGDTSHKIEEFIDDIASAYNWADVVVCRAGAITVSEIATVGLPALFIPFMHNDRHQYWNARFLEQVGAAKIIEQADFSIAKVSALLEGWDRAILLTMAQRALSIAIPNATELVVQEVEATARRDGNH
ncbi:UDP-N-acetylglucosamine--N-acetylmuramyl-(pentapeptide) pyrophosphoryl-undecaprenol N-acetylglucosamine transferase [secondary endosymbiont of Heteropsylla cubana]|uniref:UDP-N-acetylglucosamine--N-acetylmuramyl-(pentapeptide) pyrophosphoryl-undecaprenol N-acetylglucosamine transferase n=1 Tax=secondary endosymbiont of Heteropsylla cubana TaxID=134287 RepID=J3TZ13_9ENTR|nr:undecaprenyldiphospho-muramoylpentapeptide beta-N-acetylglucosaminyltransferase [secondary endosymbiont of Heteropsylla cubana]AFP85690.1 UDP-N-acetylglucosamine--N-acetylmuramyl-(pentapeptide) pyrophosphoryl-undecaprenol N-acetylglucosamine transferase [secondary endosymbiont of Heteropsylla cubana]